jgi:TonB-linked SusC/RagA family outer membrane protein
MNFTIIAIRHCGWIPQKIRLIMKLTTLLILAVLLQVSAKTYSQVTLQVKNTPLEKVLKSIKQQSGYAMIYDAGAIPNTKITLNLVNVGVDAALQAALIGQQLNYKLVQNNIVLLPAEPSVLEQLKAKAARLLDISSTISGRITDTLGKNLAGASVALAGTTYNAVTDEQGNFNLMAVPQGTYELTISYIGYQKLETTVVNSGKNIHLELNLHPSQDRLDEVQVIAYGTTTQRLNTGDATKVSAADIGSQPLTNVLGALEGRVPGMIITQTSGVPGSSFNVQIRGQSALDLSLSQNNPLFIIDGVPFESGDLPSNQLTSAANNPTQISSGGLSPLNSISPGDIESVEVLKDADATAIYGSRGANGVILITTKKGKAGATKYTISVNSGYSRVARDLQMMNTQQYVQMRKEAFANDGIPISNNPGDAGFAPDLTIFNTRQYTNFEKLLIGNTANSTDVQGSVSGGDSNTQFMIGGGYHRETTVFPGDFADAVASMHFTINHSSANKKFNLQFSGIYGNDNNQLPGTDMTRYINLPPDIDLYANGKLAWQEGGVPYDSLGEGDIINPLSLENQKYQSINENLLANLLLSYKLLDNLVFRSSFGYNTFRSDESSLMPSTSIDPNSGQLPSSAFGTGVNRNWIVEPQLEYTGTTKHGKLDILLGSTFQDKTSSASSIYGYNYTSDLLLNSIEAAPVTSVSNNYDQYRYTALFGRINYNLDEKYIVDLTARRDGSSRFSPENRFANFGAVGAAWLFSQEEAIKSLLPFLSFGKLRGSYGVTGNDQIGDYKYLNLWNSTSNPYDGIPGLYPASLYNPDYTWEINKKFEAAIELGFLADRLLFSASYYNNRSSNQLVNYSLPEQTGFFSVVRNFPGLVENDGWEFEASSKNVHSKDFNWTTAFNLTIPRNKLLAFPNLRSSNYAEEYVIGQPLNLIYTYKYTGVDPKTGLYTVQDVNKDRQFTQADYQVLGTTNPTFYGGLQNSLSYKQFDLSFFFEFRKQLGLNYLSQLTNTPPGFIYNQPLLALNRWQKPGDVKPVQQYTTQYGDTYLASAYLSVSNGIYSDASFVRLKTLSLSYRLPADWLKRYHISGCRLYLEGQNLLTLTGYKGSDPESQNFFILPPLRTIVAGAQFNF